MATDTTLKSKLTGTRVTSVSTTISSEEKQQREPPAGAKILSKTVRTETEKIENGYIISKSFDIRYKLKGESGSEYAYYTKKWYSKEDPLTITLDDKTLADEFTDDETD